MTGRPRGARRRSAFTIVEMAIAFLLLGVLFAKLTLLFGEASETHRRESRSMALEDQARTVLDRISFAVIGSDPDTLDPNPLSPFDTEELEYRVSMGVENGVPVWSDTEVIGLDADDPSQLFWAENRGLAAERIVVWCRTVSEYFESELGNGADDNTNGLIDELGLSFVREGDNVRIRLTLERETEEGPLRVTDETFVHCRN